MYWPMSVGNRAADTSIRNREVIRPKPGNGYVGNVQVGRTAIGDRDALHRAGRAEQLAAEVKRVAARTQAKHRRRRRCGSAERYGARAAGGIVREDEVRLTQAQRPRLWGEDNADKAILT